MRKANEINILPTPQRQIEYHQYIQQQKKRDLKNSNQLIQKLDRWKVLMTILKAVYQFCLVFKFTRISSLTLLQRQLIADKTYFNEERRLSSSSSAAKKQSHFKRILLLMKNKLLKIFYKMPLFNPNNFSVLLWEMIIFSLEIFLFFYFPFEFAFLEDQLIMNILWVQLVFSFFLFFDIFKNCKTIIYIKGTPISDHDQILRKYVKSCKMLLDLITFAAIFASSWNYINLVFLLRLCYKQSLVKKFINNFDRSDRAVAFTKLGYLFLTGILICHLIACVWFKIGIIQLKHEQGWIYQYKWQDASLATSYINSYFFATIHLTSIKGNLFPITNIEKGFCILLGFIGSIFFGFCFSSISIILREIRTHSELSIKKISQLRKYLKDHDVDKSISKQANMYLQNSLHFNNSDAVTHNTTLNSLPQALKQDILTTIYLKSLKCVPFFKENFSTRCLEKLSMKLESKFLEPEEVLISKYKKQEKCLYIIFSGGIEEYVHCNSNSNQIEDIKIFNKKFKGEVLGQYEFFSGSEKIFRLARSVRETEVHILKLDDFKEVIKKFPTEKEKIDNLRDELVFNKNLKVIGQKCHLCERKNHLEKDCSNTFYDKRQISFYKKFQEEEKKAMKAFARKQRKTKFIFDQKFNHLYQSKTNNKNQLTFQAIKIQHINEKEENYEVPKIENKNELLEEDNLSESSILLESLNNLEQKIERIDVLGSEIIQQQFNEEIELKILSQEYNNNNINTKKKSFFKSLSIEDLKENRNFTSFDDEFQAVQEFDIYFPHNNFESIVKQYNLFMKKKQRYLDQHSKSIKSKRNTQTQHQRKISTKVSNQS